MSSFVQTCTVLDDPKSTEGEYKDTAGNTDNSNSGKLDDEKNFFEYKHYPNEYTTIDDKERQGRKYQRIKDAVNVDTEDLKKELTAIREEDDRLGSIV